MTQRINEINVESISKKEQKLEIQINTKCKLKREIVQPNFIVGPDKNTKSPC